MLFSCSCASHKFGQFREFGLQLAVRGGQGNGKLSMKSYRTVNYQWWGRSHGKSHRNCQLSALIMLCEKWRRANSVGSITSSYSKKVKKVQVCLHCRCFSPSGEPLLQKSLSFRCHPPSDVSPSFRCLCLSWQLNLLWKYLLRDFNFDSLFDSFLFVAFYAKSKRNKERI